MTAGNLTAVSLEAEQKSTARLILVITLLLVFIMAARSPLDSDLWWHLRAGEETLDTGYPVLADSYSYTRAGTAWTNHSWLGQVILALLYRAGGFPALGALVAVTAAACIGVVYAQMQSPALLRAFILILASLVAAPVWSPRPQLFSQLLLAVTGYIVYLYRERHIDRLVWLLPLFGLWSNLHGGYPLGLLLIAATAGGEVLNHLLDGSKGTKLSWRQTGKLALVGAGAFLVTAINPNGYRMWLIPFETVGVGVLQNLIQEWASPDFHDPVQQPFLALLFATIAAIGLAEKRRDGADLAVLVVFSGIALAARRNFGPFALTTVPVLSRAVMDCAAGSSLEGLRHRPFLRTGNFLRRLDQKAAPLPRAVLFNKIANLAIVGLLGFAAAGKLYATTHPALIERQIEDSYPAAAVVWLKTHRPPGQLFNAYNWGGYLLHELHEYPVFVDGRTDLYGDDILTEWINVVEAGDGWQQALEKWGVRLILVEPNRPVVVLLPSEGWTLLLSGKGFVLYGR